METICIVSKGFWKVVKWGAPKAARVGLGVAKRGVNAAASTKAGKVVVATGQLAAEWLAEPEKVNPLPESRSTGSPIFALLAVAAVVIGLVAFYNFHPTETDTTTPPKIEQTHANSSAQFATVGDAQKAAVRQFPALIVAGSKLNADFVARYNFYKQYQPTYFNDTRWPVNLAAEVSEHPLR
ncbi:MAG: hypothetical protein WDN28_30395 [Chthoniobacter sp.]